MNVRDLHAAHVDALLANPDELTATDTTWTHWTPALRPDGLERATFPHPDDLDPDDGVHDMDDLTTHHLTESGDVLA